MAQSSLIALTTIVLAVIHAGYQQSEFSSTYPIVRTKPRIYEQNLPTYQLKRKFIPRYPMPDLSGTVFHQPLNVFNLPVVIALIEDGPNKDTVPVVHQSLDKNLTLKIPAPDVKIIKTDPASEVISMTSLFCLNSLSSIAFSFLPINSSRLRGFCS
ncbi:hypothetical protein DAPPUDRAFT_114070 [Daphnia pulex]|uniref:Vitellogenin domain-containing protein n=1 Tax=Daphnia pulex TaxID=6669 RepID=E9HGX4_DAPPU|nr:hypothetical protein DAPPUDRAFT_114070 [Daphnia pulex]|eukprot:EFX69039.1 hypothetical protein DAPPUDRAFT_114070 [Daphnia pulex]